MPNSQPTSPAPSDMCAGCRLVHDLAIRTSKNEQAIVLFRAEIERYLKMQFETTEKLAGKIDKMLDTWNEKWQETLDRSRLLESKLLWWGLGTVISIAIAVGTKFIH